MLDQRVRDYLILIGHTWICTDCRQRLLDETDAMLIGHKLSEDERERVGELNEDSYRTMMDLAEATGLTMDDLRLAIDHPRSRLRHLGVYRRR
ncbi:MAG: hypothetical protein KDD84_22440 [Caldilineaceae bacterium]|nr:hypothetical protein [Caldilineaceae bacterium]